MNVGPLRKDGRSFINKFLNPKPKVLVMKSDIALFEKYAACLVVSRLDAAKQIHANGRLPNFLKQIFDFIRWKV